VAGKPVGVVSQCDLLIHERERVNQGTSAGRPARDEMLVADLMTPVVFGVTLETSASRVIDYLLEMHVHRLFVVDNTGVLIGVISAIDILRHLEEE